MTTRAQLAIVGMPGTGKTTLSNALSMYLDLPVLHTDDFKGLPWAKQADAAMECMPARGIVEGVSVVRMFRRGFRPDCVVYLTGGIDGSPSLRSLIANGLMDYDLALTRGDCVGRVLYAPERASAATVLHMLGAAGPEH